MNFVERPVLIGIHLVERTCACNDRLVPAFEEAQITNQALHVARDLLQLKEEIVSTSDGDARHTGAGGLIVRAYAFTDESPELFMQSTVGFDLSFGVEIEPCVHLGLVGGQQSSDAS